MTESDKSGRKAFGFANTTKLECDFGRISKKYNTLVPSFKDDIVAMNVVMDEADGWKEKASKIIREDEAKLIRAPTVTDDRKLDSSHSSSSRNSLWNKSDNLHFNNVTTEIRSSRSGRVIFKQRPVRRFGHATRVTAMTCTCTCTCFSSRELVFVNLKNNKKM